MKKTTQYPEQTEGLQVQKGTGDAGYRVTVTVPDGFESRLPLAVARTLADLGLVDLAEVGREERKLPVALTDAELIERGNALARIEQDEDEHVEQARQHKDLAKGCAATALGIRAEVLARTTPRSVKCVKLGDLDAGVTYTLRLDTGELVGKREMTEDERQLELPSVGGDGTPAAGKKAE